MTTGLQTRPRRRAWRPALFALVAVSCMAGKASAQSVTLTLSSSSISFTAGDPDTFPTVAASALTVTYRVRNNAWGNWAITLIASGNLSSGLATIAVSNVTWTATPSGTFSSGTMSASAAQTLASGSGNVDPSRTGQVTFALANSWSYDVGTYNTTFSFTLTAP
jgi:hypothetical protein